VDTRFCWTDPPRPFISTNLRRCATRSPSPEPGGRAGRILATRVATDLVAGPDAVDPIGVDARYRDEPRPRLGLDVILDADGLPKQTVLVTPAGHNSVGT